MNFINKIKSIIGKFQPPWGLVFNGHRLYGLPIKKKFRPFEPETTEFFKKNVKNGEKFLDAGANSGYYTTLLSDLVGGNGIVVGYEPDLLSFKRLSKSTKNLRNVIIYNKAVYRENSQLKFFYQNEGEGKNSTAYKIGENSRFVDAVSIKNEAISNFDWAKIDIEGGEVDALRGMLPTKSVVEISRNNTKALGLSLEDLLREIESLNYDIYCINKNGEKNNCSHEEIISEVNTKLHKNILIIPRD